MEIIKLINEHSDLLVNRIYTTGKISEELLVSTFLTIPKKTHPKKYDDVFRLISLMSHILKTFLRVIHTRIRTKCELDLDSS